MHRGCFDARLAPIAQLVVVEARLCVAEPVIDELLGSGGVLAEEGGRRKPRLTADEGVARLHVVAQPPVSERDDKHVDEQSEPGERAEDLKRGGVLTRTCVGVSGGVGGRDERSSARSVSAPRKRQASSVRQIVKTEKELVANS
eukprot:6214797-Pleurochrysis_carterae.AAC.2